MRGGGRGRGGRAMLGGWLRIKNIRRWLRSRTINSVTTLLEYLKKNSEMGALGLPVHDRFFVTSDLLESNQGILLPEELILK